MRGGGSFCCHGRQLSSANQVGRRALLAPLQLPSCMTGYVSTSQPNSFDHHAGRISSVASGHRLLPRLTLHQTSSSRAVLHHSLRAVLPRSPGQRAAHPRSVLHTAVLDACSIHCRAMPHCSMHHAMGREGAVRPPRAARSAQSLVATWARRTSLRSSSRLTRWSERTSRSCAPSPGGA